MIRKFIILTLITLVFYSILGCQRCSRSGNNKHRSSSSNKIVHSNTHRNFDRNVTSNSSTIKMIDKGEGVYYVPCKINGVEMEFILDTGASNIVISVTEALYLYKNGKLSSHDFIGMQEYVVADGSIGEGTVINLKEVQIGNKKLKNIQATVIHNLEASLLLGQSALSQFGKVSIDYNKKEIKFE